MSYRTVAGITVSGGCRSPLARPWFGNPAGIGRISRVFDAKEGKTWARARGTRRHWLNWSRAGGRSARDASASSGNDDDLIDGRVCSGREARADDAHTAAGPRAAWRLHGGATRGPDKYLLSARARAHAHAGPGYSGGPALSAAALRRGTPETAAGGEGARARTLTPRCRYVLGWGEHRQRSALHCAATAVVRRS